MKSSISRSAAWLFTTRKRTPTRSSVKAKRTFAAPASDLYTSQLFRALRGYAIGHADAWYVLSAEHGLLRPDQVVVHWGMQGFSRSGSAWTNRRNRGGAEA